MREIGEKISLGIRQRATNRLGYDVVLAKEASESLWRNVPPTTSEFAPPALRVIGQECDQLFGRDAGRVALCLKNFLNISQELDTGRDAEIDAGYLRGRLTCRASPFSRFVLGAIR